MSASERANGEGSPFEVAAVESNLAVAEALLSIGQRLASIDERLDQANVQANARLRIEVERSLREQEAVEGVDALEQRPGPLDAE
jgi:hypothetical protein